MDGSGVPAASVLSSGGLQCAGRWLRAGSLEEKHEEQKLSAFFLTGLLLPSGWRIQNGGRWGRCLPLAP